MSSDFIPKSAARSAQFDLGAITSDGGGLLLREAEKRVGILRQSAACFTDYRNPDLIELDIPEPEVLLLPLPDI